MDVSKFLSKSIGIYLVLVSTVMLFNTDQFLHLVKDLLNNPPLMFITGFITLVLGILMVVGHQVWQWNWRLMITLFAWLILLKGLSILIYPQYMDKLTIEFLKYKAYIHLIAGFDFTLGILFCYFGFKP